MAKIMDEADADNLVAGSGYMMHYKELKTLMELWLLHPDDTQIAKIARTVLTSSFWDFTTNADGSSKKVVEVTDGAQWLRQLFERTLLREARSIRSTLRNFMHVVHGLEQAKDFIEERMKQKCPTLETDLKQISVLQDKIGVYMWQMEQYAALNYKAFHKILTKYDQHLNINAVQTYMPIVDKMLAVKVRLELSNSEEGIDVMAKGEKKDDGDMYLKGRRRLSSYEILSEDMELDDEDDGSKSAPPQICRIMKDHLIPPIIKTVAHNYGLKQFQEDVACSIVISLAGIPKAMSYAGLSGVPVELGIATLYMPCLVYGLLGSSRQISISPQSVTCLLLAQLVDDAVGSDIDDVEQEKIALTMMFTMASGIMMVACGVLNLSMLFNFISKPVLSGFISASALIAAFSTAKSLLSIYVKKSPVLYTLIGRICEALPDTHAPTACISVIGVIIMVTMPFGQKKAAKKLEKIERCRRCAKVLWFFMKVPSVIYICLLGMLLGAYLCEFNAFFKDSTKHVVSGMGASSISNFYGQVGERFTCDLQSEKIEMEYRATGSGAGLREIMTNVSNDTLSIDFTTSDVLPPAEDLSNFGVHAFPVAAAFVCPMVNIPLIQNSGQITLVLDMSTVAAIFTGEITSWTDERIRLLNQNLPWGATLDEIPISVVVRSDSSGTTNAFSEALHGYATNNDTFSPGLKVNWTAPTKIHVDGNQGVIEQILSTPWSIGYTSWSSESQAEIACAGFPIQGGGIVTTKLAWKQRIGAVSSSYHQFVWPIKLVNYMLVPSIENADRIRVNGQPREEDSCASRRWLYQYLEHVQKSDEIAKLHMLELMQFMNGLPDILCSHDRHLASSQDSDNGDFVCKKKAETCRDIKMVGYFPSSFLRWEFHSPKSDVPFGTIFANAVLLSAVAVLEHVANAKLYADRNGYHVSISKDLVAVGLSNVLGSCFGSFIVAGGFSRSALNARAASQVSGLLSVFVSVIVVFALAPLLSMLPDAVLNIILVVSVVKVIDYKFVLQLWRLGQRGMSDLVSLSIAFFATCFLGVVSGMIVSMGFNLIIFVFNSAYPQILLLKRTPGTMAYEPESQKPVFVDVCGNQMEVPSMFSFQSKSDETDTEESKIRILRFEAPIWYANVGRLVDWVSDQILLGIEGIVLDMSSVSWVDVTACGELKKMFARTEECRVHLVFANTNQEVEHMLKTTCEVAVSRFFASLYKSELAAEMWGRTGDINEAIRQGLQAVEKPPSLGPRQMMKRMATMAWSE